MVSVYFKHDATPDSEKGNMAYYLQQYLVYMASSMLNTRFMELQQSANPPFVGAGGGYGDYFLSQTKSAFTVTAQAKPNGIVEAMQCLLTEVERAAVTVSLRRSMSVPVPTICRALSRPTWSGKRRVTRSM